VSTYEELDAQYQAALAELERARDAADGNPSDEVLAARSDLAYHQAQQTYAALLASMGEPVPAVAEAAYAPTSTPVSAAAPLPSDYVPLEAPPQGESQYGSPSPTAHPAFGTPLAQASPVGVILTRPTPTTRFTPSDTSLDDLVPIQRGLLAPAAADRKSELGKNRNIAGSLPGWSPLPPGEIVALGRKR